MGDDALKKGYHRSSKAWYADVTENVKVVVGVYYEDGGTAGEFTVEWVHLYNKNNNPQFVPVLKVFDDAWGLLSEFKGLMEALGEVNNQNISEEDFCNILDNLEFEDLTEYERP